MIDNFNPKIRVANDNGKTRGLPKGVTRDQAIAHIKALSCEPEVIKRLISTIGAYPSNTLGQALKNLPTITLRVRDEMRNEIKADQQKRKEEADRRQKQADAINSDPIEQGQNQIGTQGGPVVDENGKKIDHGGGAGQPGEGLKHRLPDPAYPLRGEPGADEDTDGRKQVHS